MRFIGYLPDRAVAADFSRFLRGQGIANEMEKEREGWAVWVHCEDEVSTARGLYGDFLGNPQHPRFHVAEAVGLSAETLRASAGVCRPVPEDVEEARDLEAEVGPPSMAVGPLTLALLVGCVWVALLSNLGEDRDFLAPLFMAPFELEGGFIRWREGLTEILSGEFWRLLGPIFIHDGWLHLGVNMVWLVYLGSMVESCERTRTLAVLVLVLGAASNLGEYWFSGPLFGGMSGVIYGLLGYVWMKATFQRGSGYMLNLYTVTWMLVWFFMGVAGVVTGVANVAHAVGLGLGIVWGFGAARWITWRRAG